MADLTTTDISNEVQKTEAQTTRETVDKILELLSDLSRESQVRVLRTAAVYYDVVEDVAE